MPAITRNLMTSSFLALFRRSKSPLLKDKIFFIPSDVGLPDLQDDTFSVDDHIWHELEKIELTEEPPTLEIGASLMIENFKNASQDNWNEYAAFKRKGLL
jgi:hypothetical protein